jgi:uncharacterized membrane protein
MMHQNNQNDRDNLRIQYQQCIENFRMWDRHVWQVPSVVILINSAIIGVAFGYLKDALIPSSMLLLFGMILSFSMFIAVKKYRFFQYHAIERMRAIERQLSIEPMRLVTGKDGMNPKSWFERQPAGNWLAWTVFFAFICLTVLLVFNIVLGLCN